jgi:hypothetical protein
MANKSIKVTTQALRKLQCIAVILNFSGYTNKTEIVKGQTQKPIILVRNPASGKRRLDPLQETR